MFLGGSLAELFLIMRFLFRTTSADETKESEQIIK